MRLAISALSKPGGREPNEDAFGCWSSDSATFCLLCDGAGGHGGGEVASKLAVRVALARFQSVPVSSGAAIHGALRAAHEAICVAQDGEGHIAQMRSTAVVLAIDTLHGSAMWGHIGDSRLYCFRRGAIIARTIDHSVVQRMVDAGYLAPGDIRDSPERNQLFAALGQEQNFAPAIIDVPLQLENGDAFLLCTDGFWGLVADATMIDALRDAPTTEAWLALMEREVVARGGRDQDNYSALAIWCGQAS
ncbi:MAG TPA: PP2C family serine/threonine-protein phosphatase [Casimicrobiaceae bacterium]|nr:PP2C family serine/threonine-protein phosphatase [Casimicrobiaceae bacterium]